MIGLFPQQAKIYETMRTLAGTAGYCTIGALVEAFGMGQNRLLMRMKPLERRRFFRYDRFGFIVVQNPPHEIVLQSIAEQCNCTVSDIIGHRKCIQFVRARRLVAKRLRSEYLYPLTEIAKALQKHVTTVEDYFLPERSRSRSRIRAKRQLIARQRLAETQPSQ